MEIKEGYVYHIKNSYFTDLYKDEYMRDMSTATLDTTVQDSIDEVMGC